MVAQSRSTVPQASRQPTRVPLSILRTETVLSRFPIHHLTQVQCPRTFYTDLDDLICKRW
jgi:hypothetical protein